MRWQCGGIANPSFRGVGCLFLSIFDLLLPLVLQSGVPEQPVRVRTHELGFHLGQAWQCHGIPDPFEVGVADRSATPLDAEERDVEPALLIGHADGSGKEVIRVELECWWLHSLILYSYRKKLRGIRDLRNPATAMANRFSSLDEQLTRGLFRCSASLYPIGR
jgi:hypothetical protein